MLRKIGRLFIVKTRVEAYIIIYALATGAAQRGLAYLGEYPGFGGKMVFWACMGSVLLAGGKILDCLRFERERAEADTANAVG